MLQHAKAVALDFNQQRAIDRRHDQAGALRAAILRRQQREGFVVQFLGAFGLEAHQPLKAVAVLRSEDVGRRHLELL